MPRTNLNFHQTFKPEKQYISSILTAIDTISSCDIHEISHISGIPTGKSSGKVEPTLCYAEYMGFIEKKKIDGKYSLKYTSLGECVKNEDVGLLEKLTLLLMHCMLIKKINGAELWATIFNDLFPLYHNTITSSQFDKEIEERLGVNVKTGPFFGSYQDLFGPLNLIDVKGAKISLNPMRVERDYVYLYAYVLFDYWDEWIRDADDVASQTASSEEIPASYLREIGFRNPFGWSEETEYQVLEMLAEKGLIDLNRQMVPVTIRRTVKKENLIYELYSELC